MAESSSEQDRLPVGRRPFAIYVAFSLAVASTAVGLALGLHNLNSISLSRWSYAGTLLLGLPPYLLWPWFAYRFYIGGRWARWLFIIGSLFMPFGVIRRIQHGADEFTVAASAAMAALCLAASVFLV